MSWAAEAVAAIRKMILLEERVAQLTDRVDRLASAYGEIDRRLLKIEAKFELMERLAASSPRSSQPRRAKLHLPDEKR